MDHICDMPFIVYFFYNKMWPREARKIDSHYDKGNITHTWTFLDASKKSKGDALYDIIHINSDHNLFKTVW